MRTPKDPHSYVHVISVFSKTSHIRYGSVSSKKSDIRRNTVTSVLYDTGEAPDEEQCPADARDNRESNIRLKRAELEELEAEQKQIEDALCSGTLSIDELTEKSKRLPVLKDELDEKSLRWLELSEIEN